MQEVFAHQQFVGVDGRRIQQRLAQIGVEVGEFDGSDLLDVGGVDVACLTRQLEVFDEAAPVVHSLLVVVVQPQVENACFQRVLGSRQLFRKRPYAVEPGCTFSVVVFQVHIRARGQLAQAGLHKRLLAEPLRKA